MQAESRRKSVKLEGGFDLSKCDKCQRTFKAERLEEHEKFCTKRAYTPKKPSTANLNDVETPITAKFAGFSPPTAISP